MFFLTPSKANLKNECPRCFYLEMHKLLSRPRGIMSSVPGRMDTLLKKRYDEYRSKCQLPPELVGKIYGKLFIDQDLLKKMRHWNGPQKTEFPELDITLRGAIDDLVVEPDGTYSPLDYKSKGTPPKPGYGELYYKWQMQFYSLMLSRMGLKPSGKAYLVFYSFDEISLSTAALKNVNAILGITVQEIQTDTNSAFEFIEDSSVLLSKKNIPNASPTCEYCSYTSSAIGLQKEGDK